MWLYEHLLSAIGGIFLGGIAWHFARRWVERRHYAALRIAYSNALAAAQHPAQLESRVTFAEYHRALMTSDRPGWLDGLGRQTGRMVKVCLLALAVALFLKGPVERGESQPSTTSTALTTRGPQVPTRGRR